MIEAPSVPGHEPAIAPSGIDLRAMFPNSPQMFEPTPESPLDPVAARLFPSMAPPQPAEGVEQQAPAIPDAYRDLTPPEGFTLDPAAFAPVAAQLAAAGYTKPQVEKALAIHADLERRQDAAVAAENARWRQEAEKALQPGDREAITAVMATAPAEVRQLLGRTGLGNHPALVRWVASLGRQFSGRRSR